MGFKRTIFIFLSLHPSYLIFSFSANGRDEKLSIPIIRNIFCFTTTIFVFILVCGRNK